MAMAQDEATQQSEALKAQGNAMFQQKHYSEAIDLYTKAIELNPSSAVLYSNRSFCHLRLENHGLAEQDATMAIKIEPTFIKGYYRRGSAYYAVGKLKEAIKDLRAVCKIVPQDRDARQKLDMAQKQYRAMQFAACIESDQVIKSIDPTAIEIPDNYTGIHLPEQLTADWVIQLMDEFKNQRSIHKKYVVQLLLRVKDVLAAHESLVQVSIPDDAQFTVCGDVHGQYYDLLNIFEINGHPSVDNPYLFNGDFVDRGSFSVEVILTLFCWKVLLPNHFHLTRGNHETRNMNKIYGFEGEVKAKYDMEVMELFSEVFCYLPLVCVLNNRVMVTHGGLFSQDGVTLDDIRRIDRFKEPPESGIMCELLWSDPDKNNGRHPSKRGVGLSFGPDVAHRFLNENGLDLLVRSHEMKQEGYEVEADGRVITIFSAPNYCDQMGNKGAFIRFNGAEMSPQFTTFNAVPHPNIPTMAYARPFMFF